MTTPDTSARPPQVTFAGWSVTVASVLLVFSAFESLGTLQSVEVRDQLTTAIESGNLKGLGISVSEAIAAKRWALYVSAVAAALTAILGIYVLRRDKAARIVLSIGAVPIVLAVPLTGSFLAMLVGAGAVVLWSRPSRDWFAGRPVTPREPREPRKAETPAAQSQTGPPIPTPWVPPRAEPEPDGRAQPAPTPGWGVAPGQAPWGAPPPVPPSYPSSSPTLERPRQVRNACWITWIFSGVTALGYLAILAAIAIDQQALVDVVKENPAWDTSYDDDLIVTAAVVGSILFLVWCAAVSVIAVFTWRGAQWAWILHLISTGVAALVALLALPWSLVHIVGIGAAFGFLLSKSARTWFTNQRR